MKEKIIEIKIKECAFSELEAEDRELVETAKRMALGSYAPYSKFHVGAAIRMENGEIVGGSNQENAAYPSGTCLGHISGDADEKDRHRRLDEASRRRGETGLGMLSAQAHQSMRRVPPGSARI